MQSITQLGIFDDFLASATNSTLSLTLAYPTFAMRSISMPQLRRDIKYAIRFELPVMLANNRYQLMIPSVRNSESQHLSVFKAAQCTRVLHTAMFKPVIARIKEQRPELQSFPVPHLDQLIEVRCARYEYNKKWADARTDPIVIAHSSGSTGRFD